jgi:hypothetical protein
LAIFYRYVNYVLSVLLTVIDAARVATSEEGRLRVRSAGYARTERSRTSNLDEKEKKERGFPGHQSVFAMGRSEAQNTHFDAQTAQV